MSEETKQPEELSPAEAAFGHVGARRQAVDIDTDDA